MLVSKIICMMFFVSFFFVCFISENILCLGITAESESVRSIFLNALLYKALPKSIDKFLISPQKKKKKKKKLYVFDTL